MIGSSSSVSVIVDARRVSASSSSLRRITCSRKPRSRVTDKRLSRSRYAWRPNENTRAKMKKQAK